MQCQAEQFGKDSDKHAQTNNGTCQTASYLSIDFQASACHYVVRLQLLRRQQIPNALCGVPIDRAPPFGTGPQAEALSSLERAVANSTHLLPRAFSDKSPLSPPQHPFVLLSSINSSLQQPPFLLRPPGRPPANPSSHFSEAAPPPPQGNLGVQQGPCSRGVVSMEGRGRALPPSGGAASSPSSHWYCEFLLLFSFAAIRN
jgi:hypothetical protein